VRVREGTGDERRMRGSTRSSRVGEHAKIAGRPVKTLITRTSRQFARGFAKKYRSFHCHQDLS